ncbi:YybH family protein [Paucibacter sp. Y2R2-4]|uniref:YybH family protein n=1 Tax=Paucibacter sp. Y2R2-4 TaxID=2893553 RepID=UPI0021E40332|nr:nuclear transport factor 2 family protein [Paucibacter sp. Y2R2-4]MCV2352196.1 nuclear transport factor 2 family protein [Paucibacter sp. Y2R2-4]
MAGLSDLQAWQAQVIEAECGFAASMAQGDLQAFARHLGEHALFFGGAQVLSGRAAVLEGWRSYFQGDSAPFSWAPDQVVVAANGSLAHSSGLVRGPKGDAIARFHSVWRQEAPGQWRVVVDRGSALSEAEKLAAGVTTTGPCAQNQ